MTEFNVVDSARFMQFRQQQAEKALRQAEKFAELAEEPCVRRRSISNMSPKQLLEMENERNDVLGVLDEFLADLREPDEDGVFPPLRMDGHRVFRKLSQNKKVRWEPKNPEAVGILIYLVQLHVYQFKCSRTEAFERVAQTGLVDCAAQISALFYGYATDQEIQYLPYVRRQRVQHGRVLKQVFVQRKRT